MFSKIIENARRMNIQGATRFELLKTLKCNTVFDTFKNVKSFNRLQEVKRDIKAIKGRKNKNPEGYKAKQSLFEEVQSAERLPVAERDAETVRISNKAYREKLKQKYNKGKKLSKTDIRGLKDIKFRNGMKFLKQSSFIVPLMLYANKDDISSAYDNCGTLEAVEEADKSAFMGIMGLSVVKYSSKQCRNLAATAAIYTPRVGRFIKPFGIIGGIFAGLGIKMGFDKLWQTEYEKYKTSGE